VDSSSLYLVLSPDVTIRFIGGSAVIQAGPDTAKSYVLGNPENIYLSWLTHFSVPTTLNDALKVLPEEARARAEALVDSLRRNGAIILSTVVSMSAYETDQSASEAQQHLRWISSRVHELASDLAGFGPEAERLVSASSGIGITRRLQDAAASIASLRLALNNVRDAYLSAQIEALGIRSSNTSMKLHFGCGPFRLDGWINIDVHPAPLAMNALWPLPFSDRSARYVFVSHMLEHFFYPHEVGRFLDEIVRVLSAGGVVRIIVPDIEQCIEAYCKKDASFFEGRAHTWHWWPKNQTQLDSFLAYAGAGPEPGAFFSAHKYAYDFETLKAILEKAGLNSVTRSTFMGSKHDELRVDDSSEVAHAKYQERFYSLFVEATKGP
jgi:predicted SAM-dependent methyltransferase